MATAAAPAPTRLGDALPDGPRVSSSAMRRSTPPTCSASPCRASRPTTAAIRPFEIYCRRTWCAATGRHHAAPAQVSRRPRRSPSNPAGRRHQQGDASPPRGHDPRRIDADQRAVSLPIDRRTADVRVRVRMPLPQRAVSPAGPYMLFVDRTRPARSRCRPTRSRSPCSAPMRAAARSKPAGAITCTPTRAPPRCPAAGSVRAHGACDGHAFVRHRRRAAARLL